MFEEEQGLNEEKNDDQQESEEINPDEELQDTERYKEEYVLVFRGGK